VTVGNRFIYASQRAHKRLIVIDVNDPLRPVEVSDWQCWSLLFEHFVVTTNRALIEFKPPATPFVIVIIE